MKTKTKAILILIETLLVFFLGFAAGAKAQRIGFKLSQSILNFLVVVIIILIVVIFLYVWIKGKKEKRAAEKAAQEEARQIEE